MKALYEYEDAMGNWAATSSGTQLPNLPKNNRKCFNISKTGEVILSVANSPPTPEQRIQNYLRETGYPNGLYPGGDGRLLGIWVMGNSYQVESRYYGGYPHGYLKRVKALFPEKSDILHIFSGKVDLGALPGDTVDIDESLSPTFLDDAQNLSNVPVENYDLILADPPYSVEDAEHYKPTMIKRNKVMRALGDKAKAGTHVVWLDQVLPMYRKVQWDITGIIGMVKSTNHRFRVVTIFEKK